MPPACTRRQWLAGTAALAAAGGAPAAVRTDRPFRFMFNTATIMGQKLPLTEQIEVAATAGYDAIEPWISDLETHKKAGKSLKDAGKQARDRGLTVESAIGFATWIVDDEAARKKGLEQAKRDMELMQELGGTRIAAPPVGATDKGGLDLLRVADRYRDLCALGAKMGVIPQVELWGFSKSLSRLGETVLVAMESGHPQACVLADVYHLYKGGSDFGGLKMLGGPSMQVFHMNDYPAGLSRQKINDADRIFPGDGVAPLVQILRDLHTLGFRGLLSLELFNRDYWKRDALEVAKTGLAKMKAVAAKAMAG
ncbi:MAG: sugar phosphate isomerase/epimerase family protein [Gemmataceae bacterium]